jgi:hypothetical protein
MLVEGISKNVAHSLQLHEEVIDGIKGPRTVDPFKPIEKVDDDLAYLSNRLRLKLGREVVADLHRQASRRLDPSIYVLRIDGRQLRIPSDYLNIVAKFGQVLANAPLQVREFLPLRVKNESRQRSPFQSVS